MRKYAALYLNNVWMVMYQDRDGIEWYIHIPNAGSMDNANQIAKLITEAEAKY